MNLTVEDIYTIYPELDWILDANLRKKCVDAFLSVAEKGGWNRETYQKCPLTLTIQAEDVPKLVEHIRAVTTIAAKSYEALKGIYQTDGKLWDTIIAGALMHDIGKFLEFSLDNEGRGRSSDTADILRHPICGAIQAAQVGLPDEIVHIIATHSFEGKASYKTIAAKIVGSADETAFNYATYLIKNGGE